MPAKPTHRDRPFSREGHHPARGSVWVGVDRDELDCLRQHGIAYVGKARWAGGSWNYFRRHGWRHVLVTLAGRGEIWYGGKWRRVTRGTVFAGRAGTEMGFRCVKPHHWDFAVVLYSGNFADPVLDHMPDPAVYPGDVEGVRRSVKGLLRERDAGADPLVLALWAALVDAEARRLIRDPPKPQRLAFLWETVEKDLAHPWTAEEMAGVMRMSVQHLRRICAEEVGIGPMGRLRYLRMRWADYLMAGTILSVEQVGLRVGYTDAFAFSKAFKRHFGVTPSQRRKAGSEKPS